MNCQQARQQLIQTCERYIVHNKRQLDRLMIPISDYPVVQFFSIAVNLGYNDNGIAFPGFPNWIAYNYHCLQKGIAEDIEQTYNDINFYLFWRKNNNFFSEIQEIHFKKREEEESACFNNRGYIASLKMLDKIDALVMFLKSVMSNKANFKDLFEQHTKTRVDFVYDKTDPTSVKVYKTLNYLKEFLDFGSQLPKYENFNSVASCLHQSMPVYDGYLKGIVIQEIQTILKDGALSDEAALQATSTYLANPSVIAILEKNLQSENEQLLKKLAVILIAVGIGIIPTLVLAIKRCYDTGGRSINFFQPLSADLHNELQELTTQTAHQL